jgi:hypothetical protein
MRSWGFRKALSRSPGMDDSPLPSLHAVPSAEFQRQLRSFFLR